MYVCIWHIFERSRLAVSIVIRFSCDNELIIMFSVIFLKPLHCNTVFLFIFSSCILYTSILVSRHKYFSSDGQTSAD